MRRLLVNIAIDADDQVGDDADGILNAEGVEVGRAFEAGVDDVGEKGCGEESRRTICGGRESSLRSRSSP